jgi:hypothetical protein
MSQLNRITLLILLSLITPAAAVAAEGKLTQVHQDFNSDPDWESVKNRVVASDPPAIKQDLLF